MKRLFKIILGLFLVMLVLAALLAAFTQTERFKSWLREQLLVQAQKSLNGKLSLGRIEGNLLSNFKLIDLKLEYQNEIVAQFASAEVGFRILPFWDGRVQIDKFLIDTPVLQLRQLADSSWNVQKLARFDSDTTAASAWQLFLSDFEIRNATIRFAPLDTASFLHQRDLAHLALRLQLHMTNARTVANVRHLAFTLSDFSPALQKLSGTLTYETDSLRFEQFVIEAGESKFSGTFLLKNFSRPEFHAQIAATPLHLHDLQTFFPKLKIGGPLQLETNFAGDLHGAAGTLALEHAAGTVQTTFAVRNDSLASYNLNAKVRRLDVGQLLPEQQQSSRLNFDLTLNGQGISLQEMRAHAKVSMDSSRFQHVTISSLKVEANVNRDEARCDLQVISPVGELTLNGSARNIQHEQVFALKLDARQLHVAALLQDTMLVSNLSFSLTGEGRSFDPQKTSFRGRLAVAPANFKQIHLDTLYGVFEYRERELLLDTLRAESNLARLIAHGRTGLERRNDITFRVELGDLELARRAFEADTLDAHGIIAGRVFGAFDSLQATGQFNLNRVKYNRTKLDTLFGDFTFAQGDSAGGVIHAVAQKILAAIVPVDSIRAVINYDLSSADILADFWEGLENRGNLQGRYVYGEVGRFHVHEASFDVLKRHWETPPDSMWIDVGDEDYNFHNVKVRSGRTQVFMHGKIDLIGEQNFYFGIDELELASLAEFFERKEELRGNVAFESHLTGAFEQPKISGHWLWRRGKLAEFAFEHLAGSFIYDPEKISWDFMLAQDSVRTLTGEGFLPVRTAGGDSGLVVRDDRPIRIQAATSDLDLAFLQTFMPKLRRIRGSLTFDAKIENTLKDPRPFGFVRVYDGAFNVPEYGTSYREVELGLQINPGLLKLTSLKMTSDKGGLEVKADIKYEKDKITSAEGFLTAKDFLVARTRNLDLLLDAEVRVAGDLNEVRYTGNVTVDRSRFFLQGLQRQSLVEVDTESFETETPADCTAVAADKQTTQPLAGFLQNVQGQLKITIPRNTWIRGPEVNLEIEGELDFIQAREDFSAFGSIKIVRGNYDLFGKRFAVQQGEIGFQGNVKNPPNIVLEARYVYRLDKSKHEMFVKITGALNNPQIEFLDERKSKLEEKEALAILLFNVPFDRLGLTGEIEGSGEKMDITKTARGLVSGLVSNQLSRTLGKSLRLDVIEFESGGELDLNSVMVGKYLTNDIFVSVEQDFSSSADALRVALEYEIAKFLFLQAAKGGKEDKETGFDIILKKEW